MLTIAAIAMAMYMIRKGNVRAHLGFIIATFAGLVIAGGFTFVPGRLMYQAVFGI